MRKKKRKVWFESPVGSKSGRARCACHYAYPCSHKGKK